MSAADVIASVCALVARGDSTAAARTLTLDLPHSPHVPVRRKYTAAESLRVFRRDGFIDRYSGERLVFPGTLRLLSIRFPSEFPYHPNWRMSEVHESYWRLSPTIDHLQPVSRGGRDEPENWVTTSQLRNNAKAHWTLAELGWTLHPPGDLDIWDGLLGWFVGQVEADPGLARTPAIRRWFAAGLAPSA